MQGNEKAFNKLDPMETKNVVDDVAYQADVKFLAHKLSVRIQETDHDHQFKNGRLHSY